MNIPNKVYHPASSYIFWQGLKGITAASTLFIAAATLQSWWPFEKIVTILLLASALFLAGRLNERINTLYADLFGEHQQKRSQKIKVWLFFYPGIVAAILADIFLAPPLLLSALYMGLAFALFWQLSGRRFHHYLVNTVLLVGLAFLPLFSPIEVGMEALGTFLVALGALYLIGGILEHQDAKRSIKSIKKRTHD